MPGSSSKFITASLSRISSRFRETVHPRGNIGDHQYNVEHLTSRDDIGPPCAHTVLRRSLYVGQLSNAALDDVTRVLRDVVQGRGFRDVIRGLQDVVVHRRRSLAVVRNATAAQTRVTIARGAAGPVASIDGAAPTGRTSAATLYDRKQIVVVAATTSGDR